jgi:hypothetical protein
LLLQRNAVALQFSSQGPSLHAIPNDAVCVRTCIAETIDRTNSRAEVRVADGTEVRVTIVEAREQCGANIVSRPPPAVQPERVVEALSARSRKHPPFSGAPQTGVDAHVLEMRCRAQWTRLSAQSAREPADQASRCAKAGQGAAEAGHTPRRQGVFRYGRLTGAMACRGVDVTTPAATT